MATAVNDVSTYGNDTTAITKAAGVAVSLGLPLVFSPGSYTYNGPGIDLGNSWAIQGDGAQFVSINLGPSSYLVDSAGVADWVMMEGLTINGGIGAVRIRGTPALDGRAKNICNNCFVGYTGAAISHNSADNPYWRITNNQFLGANSTSTIGIALGANSDMSVIRDNQFLRNKVHVKLDKSGAVLIEANDFIQWDAGSHRTFIWVTANYSSENVIITRNKFGNENQVPSDFRIAVTAELSGAYNGDRLPDLTSTAFAGNHKFTVSSNIINGAPAGGPVIYSRGIGLSGSIVRDNIIGGADPSYILFYDVPGVVPCESIYFGENYAERWSGAPIRNK